MNPDNEKQIICTNEEAEQYLSKTNINIIDVTDFQNGKELITYIKTDNLENLNEISENNFNINNVSVIISAAITAEARIKMSEIKIKYQNSIVYSDTDSIDLTEQIDSCYIGNELGKLKLEHHFKEAIYLAPKVYRGRAIDYEYVRIKGVKVPIKFYQLEQLLYKNNQLDIDQENDTETEKKE
jgi:hypothetical protein